MIVREALVSDPRVLPGDATPQQVAELLTHPHVESALVVDGDRLVGCITPETLVSAISEGRDLGSLTAADLADGEVPTIGPDESLEEALRVMAEHDLERLAVVDDGRFLGILPREPLIRRMAEDELDEPEPD
jgi:CBS domain-containing protein